MKQKNKREEKYHWMVSYQWTGIPDEIRIKNLEKIVDFFEKRNLKIFCSDQFQKFFDLNNMGAEENYNFCLEAQNRTENILFFIISERESKGMKLELEFAKKHNQRKILLIKKGLEKINWVKPFLEESKKIVYFDENLNEALEEII